MNRLAMAKTVIGIKI